MKEQTITKFFDNEYKQQAQNANFSRIASIWGSKPTQNKILYTVLTNNIKDWQKVEVVANVTALKTLYMGGSTNIESVIVNQAVNFVGSNNMPLLDKKGDFGARLDKSAAASRYIFTRIHDNFRKIFNITDLNILPRYNFEGEDIEYKYLSFSVPILIINGSEGMGSGHAQKIFPRSVENVKDYIIAYLNKKPLPELPVHYNGYKGTISKGELDNQWETKGVFTRNNKSTLTITEVPIGENYRSYIKKLDKLVDDNVIKNYEDLCNPKTDEFKFVIKHSMEFSRKTDDEIIDILKLSTTGIENFTVIDENNSVRVHNTIYEVINHFIELKLKTLDDRKAFIIQDIKDKIIKASSRYEFIRRIVENELVINKRKKIDIVSELNTIEQIIKLDGNYDYLLNMNIASLTEEKLISLIKDITKLKKELALTEKTTTKNMWLKDLKDV